TPPRSKTASLSMILLTPPPPSGRAHTSREKRAPAIASSRSTMRSCKPAKYSRTCAVSIWRERSYLRLDARNRAATDVFAKLHAVEMDCGDRCIRSLLRLAHGLAKRGHT